MILIIPILLLILISIPLFIEANKLAERKTNFLIRGQLLHIIEYAEDKVKNHNYILSKKEAEQLEEFKTKFINLSKQKIC